MKRQHGRLQQYPVQAHQLLPTTTSGNGDWRAFYEQRYEQKELGNLQRLELFHLADNFSLARRLLHQIDYSRDTRTIDVGAGTSHILPILGSAQSVASDITYRALRSRSHVGESRLVANSDALPFADGSFQLVVATQVLEHIPDYKRALHEYARILAPGGTLFLGVPNHYAYLARLFHPLSRDIDKSGHLRAFDPGLLVQEVSELLSIKATRHTGYLLFWGLMRLERGRRTADLITKINRFAGRRSAHLLSALLDLENSLHSRSNRGMSFELLAVKSS